MTGNAELLLTGFDAWNRDDLDGYLELLHDDVHRTTERQAAS